jgi:tetratricopeptide (TPR) repeat protein
MDIADKREAALALLKGAWDEFKREPSVKVDGLERMRRYYLKALEMDPSLSTEPYYRSPLSLVYAGLGEACAEEGLEEQSKAHYQEVVRLLDGFGDLNFMDCWHLGKAFEAMAEIEESIRSFQKAIGLLESGLLPSGVQMPSHDRNVCLAALWCDFAYLHVKQGRGDESEHCYERALQFAPDDEQIQLKLLVIRFWFKRFDRAVDLCRSMLKKQCRSRNLVMEYLAMAATVNSELDVAIRTYEELLEGMKSPEAREAYSRSLGYVEGLRDSEKDEIVLHTGGQAWALELGDRETGSASHMYEAFHQIEEAIREEVRDSASMVRLRIFESMRLSEQILEQVKRIRSDREERDQVRDRLRRDTFGDLLWETLKEETQNDLVQGELVATVNRRSDGNDYSDTVIKYARAFNFELGTRILAPFGSFVKDSGLPKATIAGNEYDWWRTKDLPWWNIGELIQEWRLILAPPKNSKNDSRFLPGSPNQEFLNKYRREQKDLVFELADLLGWMPGVVKRAEHKKELITYDEHLKLRSELIGSQGQLGLFVRLVKLFPAAK